ncbi:hypothetical protein DYB26_008606 [Aphanomyces astaci]|uniref:HTH psq-type domain-containing protein n=1 Tax=Aphanomyces astaci TaxID=112090 RepID=A0A3R7B612_APHAT|nr:hypothetical protein DYB26_008606 [Aphanomyces astaci]
MTRITYSIAFKLEALKLLETLSDYKVAGLLNVARRTLRNWPKQRNELLAYKGNKKRLKSKKPQGDLSELRDEFPLEFHRSYSAHSKECTYNVDETGFYYDMPPHYICAERGGSSKISAG